MSVQEQRKIMPGQRFTMTACFGHAATSQVHRDVGHMVHSLHIDI